MAFRSLVQSVYGLRSSNESYFPQEDQVAGTTNDSEQYVITRLFTIPGFIAIGCVGTVTNTLNVMTFLKMGVKDSATLAFFCLSLYDLGYNVALIFPGVSQFLTVVGFDFTTSTRLDPFVVYIITVNMTKFFYGCSTYVIVWIAVQRCFCVTFPFTFRDIYTTKRTLRFVLVLTCFYIGFVVIILSNYGTAWMPVPGTNESAIQITMATNRLRVFQVLSVMDCVTTVLAEMIVLVCTCVLIAHLRRSDEFRKFPNVNNVEVSDQDVNNLEGVEKQSEKSEYFTSENTIKTVKSIPGNVPANTKIGEKRTNRQLVLSVTLLSVLFFVCNLPRFSRYLIRFAYPEFDSFGKFARIFEVGADIQYFFELINASTSFVVYLSVNSKFRLTFKRAVCKQGPK